MATRRLTHPVIMCVFFFIGKGEGKKRIEKKFTTKKKYNGNEVGAGGYGVGGNGGRGVGE